MSWQTPLITDVVMVPDPPPLTGLGPVSLGLTCGQATYWADLTLPEGGERLAVLGEAGRLRELALPVLRGQRLDGLRDFAGRLRAAGVGEGAPVLTLQHAYLAAVRARPGAAEHLLAEYTLPAIDAPEPSCTLEISDRAASAERIDRLLALRPAGLGYRLTGPRVAEAIGENAEHLQRFVREVGRRAEMLAPGQSYRPAMWLSLNGALGQLAGDPVRHIGRVLGHVVGLQVAAGERQLFLEEPFRLDDELAQAANLHRLRDFIRRTPDSLARAAPTQLLAAAPPDPATAQVYVDTSAVQGLIFDATHGDLDHTLAALATCKAAGLMAYWRLPTGATPRQTELTVFLARLTGAATILVSGDDGDVLPHYALRLLAEAQDNAPNKD